MTRLLSRSLLACALSCTLAAPALAQPCERLVEAFGPQAFSSRDRAAQRFDVPTTTGEWYLVVERNGNGSARVTLNGQRVVNTNDLSGRTGLVVPITVRANNNVLQVRSSRSGVQVSVVGVAEAANLPNGVGRPVARMDLAEEQLNGHFFPRVQTLTVPSPGTEGLFLLRADNGPFRILFGAVGWNGTTIFRTRHLNVARSTTGDAPVDVQPSNQLQVLAFGFPWSQVTVRLRGFVIDEVPPTAGWITPAAGSTPGPASPLSVTYADALSGVDASSVRIELNGTDVTSSFTVDAAGASAALADLPSGALLAGANTLTVSVADAACNEAQASVGFMQGGGTGGAPAPTVDHPSSLLVIAQGASTPVQFTVRASDANDPAPQLICSPASGTAFPVGITTVTCTATNAQGGQTVVSFPVTVVDAAAPFLGQSVAAFGGAASQPAGTEPMAAVAADFDGDGDVDLAVADRQGDAVVVFVNDGSGNLSAGAPLGTGSGPTALTSADLTGDGAPDLVTANASSVTVFVNDGMGGFGSGVDTATAAGHTAVAAGDVTGDGQTDVVVAGGAVTVLAGDGSGGLTAGAAVATGASVGLVLNDFDCDGHLDAAVVGPGGLTVLTNGSGGLTAGAAQAAGTDPRGVASADLNGDGWPDLAVADASGAIQVLLGTGSGFAGASSTAAGTQPVAIAAGDVDGDGDFDLVLADASSNAASVAINDGAGGLTVGSLPLGAASTGLALADFNGDGRPDVAAAAGDGTLRTALGDHGVTGSTLEATGPAGAVATYAVGVNDAVDPSPSASVLPASGSTFALGMTPVVVSASDATGNQSQLRFDVTVQDTTPPSLPTPSDVSAEQAGPAGAVVTFAPSATDLVDPSPSVVCVPASGSMFPEGTTTVTCTATDASGNTATTAFTVTITDTTPPSLTTPPNLVVEQTGVTGAVATYTDPVATDAADPSPTVVCVPPSGSLFGAGVNPVVCTATDAAGNQTQVTFTITVQDTTAPSLSTPANVVAEQVGPAGAAVTFSDPVATDAVDPSPVVVCSPASGATFPAGVTTVTCTATDAAGNQAQATFTVTVQDTIAPTLSQPTNLVFEQVGPAGMVVNYTAPTATDVADPSPSVVCAPASGSTFAPGVTTVTCTATDAGGNQAQATFTVTVQDTLPPDLGVNPGNGVTVPAGPVTIAATYSDLASGVATGSFLAFLDGSDVSASFMVTQTFATATFPSLASGGHTLEVRISDAAGNQSLVASVFTVDAPVDVTPPLVSVTSPAAGSWAGPTATFQVGFSDGESGIRGSSLLIRLNGADVTSNFTVNLGSGTALAAAAGLGANLSAGTNTLDVYVEDNAGNGASAQQSFEYDAASPALTLDPAQGSVIDPVAQGFLATYSDGGAGIDLASVTVLLDGVDVTSSFSVGPAQASGAPAVSDGSHTWQVTVRDLAGNQTQLSATFTALSPAVALEVSVSGNPASLQIGAEHDLTVRAVTATGTTATSFVGMVTVTSSEGLPPLDGLMLNFNSLDQGSLTMSGLALFRTLGAFTIDAQSLEPPPNDISGSLGVNVVVSAPVIFPALPSSAAVVTVQGFSFAGQPVALVIDGATVETVTAAGTSAFAFSPANLSAGDHTILVRSGGIDSVSFVVSGPGVLPKAVPGVTSAGQEPAAPGGTDADAAAVYDVSSTGGGDDDSAGSGDDSTAGSDDPNSDDSGTPQTAGGPAPSPAGNVVVSNGEKRLDRVDLRIAGRGQIHFELRRRYRSQLAYDGPLGYGWDFTYNETLFIQGNGDVVRSDGQGGQALWVLAGGGLFSAPDGQLGTLRQEGDGSYTLREPDGFRRSYDSAGRLTGHRDRFGNTLTFSYDARGNLQRATDAFGRQIDFVFATYADGRDRLVTLRDYRGREVRFAYTTAGDLAEVRSPVVVGTSTGNDFPAGRIERYTYREGTGTVLDHNLTTVTRPEEVALGGAPAVTISYGEIAGEPDSYDRVTSEILGGINASGVAAGGTIDYGYTPVNLAAGPDASLSRLDVAVTERNGNLLVLQVNENQHLINVRRLTRGLRAGEPASYETRSEYDAHGQLTRRVFPEGNEVQYTYDSSPRAAQGNRVQTRWIADAARGGGEAVVTRTFEPLYQQLASQSDPRENDAGFVPPIGTKTPGRYVRTWTYDYQEGSAPVAEATDWAISLAAIARGLGDQNGDGITNQDAGNLVRAQGPAVNMPAGANMIGVLGSSTQQIVTEQRWNDRGQLTATVDAEGNQTDYAYYPENDPDGDGLTVPGQASTQTRGHLRARTVDSIMTPRRTSSRPPAALVTEYEYDPSGHTVLRRNARGVTTAFELNQLGEVVVVTRGASTTDAIARGQLPSGEAPYGYETQYTYDHNGRKTQRRVEDDATVSTTPGVAGWIDHTYTYDINDNLVEESHEIDAVVAAVTRYRYDAHGLRTEVHHPRSTQLSPVTDNVDTISYDERHLPFRLTEGAGGVTAGTYQLDYDRNGNRVRLTDGEDNDGDLVNESTLFAYDGHDRRVTTTTPLGTETRLGYDPAGNVISKQIWGHPGDQPTALIERLGETRFVHDELNRVWRVDQDLFLLGGVTPQRAVTLIDGDSNGVISSHSERDALGHERFLVEDDGGTTEQRFDGAGRLAVVLRELGNQTEYVYDQNGNLLQEIKTEHSPENLVDDQLVTTFHVYDQLDRRVRTSNNMGETDRYTYDSRDNVVATSDGNGELQLSSDPWGVFPGVINDPGNRRRYEYNGADECTAEVLDLFAGGVPGPVPTLDTSNAFNSDGQIRVGYGFDLNGNLTSITDDNGNTTSFGFDARDRRVSRTLADSSSYTFGYDRDNNLVSSSDPNGTSVTYTYDVDDRRTQVDVSRGAGVLGTTQQTFSYDGRGHVTRSTDDNGGSLLAAKLFVYDSAGRVLEETQGSLQRPVSYVYDGDGSVQSVGYAHGKTYTYTYDALDRVKTIDDPSPILADICYIGAGNRELQRDLGNFTKIYHHDTLRNQLYDDAGRVTGLIAREGFNQVYLERNYTYDRAGRRLSERRVDDFNQLDEYLYDSADRVYGSRLDQFGIGTSHRSLRYEEFTYDGAGNRRHVVRFNSIAAPLNTDYAVDSVNRYTTVGLVSRGHDPNGNLTNDGTRTYQYDFRNRLTRVALTTGEEIAVYTHDADDRRVTRLFKTAAQTVIVNAESYYDTEGRVLDQYSLLHGEPFLNAAYGPAGVDDVIFFEVTLTNYTFTRRTWYVRNPRGDLIGVTDSFSFNVLLKFIYDEFGAAYVILGSTPNPPYLFQGRIFDSETGHYQWRSRYYVPETGRFLSRDPGVFDPVNAGNQYSYVGNSPTSRGDPDGRSADLQPAPSRPATLLDRKLGR